MKVRHAAALALVGWYLMVPPMYPPNNKVDVNAPLSEWQIINSYDSARECNQGLIDLLHHHPPAGPDPGKERAVRIRLKNAQCIATDDPRLKEK